MTTGAAPDPCHVAYRLAGDVFLQLAYTLRATLPPAPGDNLQPGDFARRFASAYAGFAGTTMDLDALGSPL